MSDEQRKILFTKLFHCNHIICKIKVIEVHIGCPKLFWVVNGRRINMVIPGFLYFLVSELMKLSYKQSLFLKNDLETIHMNDNSPSQVCLVRQS